MSTDVASTNSLTVNSQSLSAVESALATRRNKISQLIEGRTISWDIDPVVTMDEAVESTLGANLVNILFSIDTSKFTAVKYTFVISTLEGRTSALNLFATVDSTNNLLDTKLGGNADGWVRINDTGILTSFTPTNSQSITVGNLYTARVSIDMHQNTVTQISAYPVVVSGTFTAHTQTIYATLSSDYVALANASTITYKS